MLLTLYDKTINAQLSEMYNSLNTLLIEAGVLPEIIMDSYSADGVEQSGLQTRTVNYYNPLENKAEHFIERSENEMSYFAANYMNGDMTISSDAIDLPESFKTVPSLDEIRCNPYWRRVDLGVPSHCKNLDINQLPRRPFGKPDYEQGWYTNCLFGDDFERRLSQGVDAI